MSTDLNERTFAELEGRTSKAMRICGRCGAPEASGIVAINARVYGGVDRHHPLKGGKTIASLSRSMCESCVVSIYEAVEDALQS